MLIAVDYFAMMLMIILCPVFVGMPIRAIRVPHDLRLLSSVANYSMAAASIRLVSAMSRRHARPPTVPPTASTAIVLYNHGPRVVLPIIMDESSTSPLDT